MKLSQALESTSFETSEKIEAGLSPEEARYAARRAMNVDPLIALKYE
jgi:hypothetical protein